MPAAADARRERHYEQLRQGLEEQGTAPERAAEIAARTVRKERAQAGEPRRASRRPVRRTGTEPDGERSGGGTQAQGAQGVTRDQLYNEARQRGIDGRSKMNKQQLARALGR